MDPELKTLLKCLLDKIEVLESRLRIVETKAHDQVRAPWPYRPVMPPRASALGHAFQVCDITSIAVC